MKQIEIGVKRKFICVVDDDDYPLVSRFQWSPVIGNRGTVYAITSERTGVKAILMHRLIMNPSRNLLVDHKDHDGLNNQKENLRICNHHQNRLNQRSKPGRKNKYTGVTQSGKRWAAAIGLAGKVKYLGTFNTQEEAALAYNNAAIATGSEFYILNVLP